MNDHTSNTYKSAFFIVPSYLLDLPDISLGYLKVYESIFQFWNHNKSCFLSEKSLCDRTNLGRSQVYAALAYFESHNELRRIKRNGKRYLVRPERALETDLLPLNETSASPDISTNVNQICDFDVRPSGRTTSGRADHNIKNLNKEKDNKYIVDFEKSTNKKSTVSKLKDYRKDVRFIKFYLAYPRHEKPLDAWKAFKSIIGDDDSLLDLVLKDIALRKEKHTQWQDKKFIPLPASYLRSGAFEGEIFNEAEELKLKKEKEQALANERLDLQEKASKERSQRELQFQIEKQTDAIAYKKTIKQIPTQLTIDALRNIRSSLGSI
ncbi:MAG TPA: hypothetical protein VGJ00_10415 [Rhabdochlamydiaceae bacterium]|jgi:hypothetical protein